MIWQLCGRCDGTYSHSSAVLTDPTNRTRGLLYAHPGRATKVLRVSVTEHNSLFSSLYMLDFLADHHPKPASPLCATAGARLDILKERCVMGVLEWAWRVGRPLGIDGAKVDVSVKSTQASRMETWS